MAESIKEYMKNFREEQKELIVRIDWCYKKDKSGEFESLENCYKARARFDMALDVKTGEMLNTKPMAFKWLEWLAPKKKLPFGFKYSYKFEEGKAYRILAREYINKPTDKFVRYYIDDVLEYDVKDKRFDPVYRFESEFGEEIFDMAVLIKSRIYGWVHSSAYRTPGTTFIASVNLKTNELENKPAFLRWIEKNSNSKIKYNFEDLGIYHIRARKSKKNENSFMLVDVIKKVRDERLEQVKEEYMKPVTFMYRETEFTLNRRYNQFEGKPDYLGEKCDVRLNVSEGDIMVENHLKKLDEIFNNLSVFDGRVREFVAEELLELANDDWLPEDEDEVTKEEFIKRIGIPVIEIYQDSSVSLMFDSDGMFTDHVITLEIDANGEFEEVKLEG